MKIGLLGYGKMGHMVDVLTTGEMEVVSRDPSSLVGCEVAIDFSHPDAVVGHVEMAIAAGCQLVIGTTGWHAQLERVRSLVEKAKIGVIYSPNFSLGVHLFLRLVAQAKRLMAPFPEYDLAGLELHHRHKVDAPSGTAMAMAKVAGMAIERCGVVRCGEIPGTHKVIYDSICDTIEISHQARSREGFARGALEAARWIMGRRGLYTLDDYLDERLGCI